MRDLVRDDVAAHVGRSEDQPPAQADPALRRAAAPARAGIADADVARATTPAAGRELGDFARHGRRAPCRFRKDSMRRARPARGPPQRSSASSRRGVRGQPSDPGIRTGRPSIGIMASGANGSPGSARASCASIQSRWSSAQASAARRLVRHGQVSFRTPARFVEAQPQSPRAAYSTDVDRRPEAPLPAPLQSGRSTT